MRAPLTPIKAFVHDAEKLGKAGSANPQDDPRLPQWLAVAQAAERIAELTPTQRSEYVQSLGGSVLPERAGRPTQTEGDGRSPTEIVAQLAERLRLEAEDMERANCFELALTTVSAVCRMLANASLPSRLLATAHLGRVNRQIGDLNAAADCYRTVTTEAEVACDNPVGAHGFIGLANVAHARGNVPEQKGFFERALELAAKDSTAEFLAHQGLALVATSQRHLADALLHGWRAHDLAPPESELQLAVLINLARTALEAGFNDASLTGFQFVIDRTSITRLRMPALGGAILAAANGGKTEAVLRFEAEGRAIIEGGAPPFEVARFCLWTAEAWHTLRVHPKVKPLLQESLSLADTLGFHELRMRAEQLLAADSKAAKASESTFLSVDHSDPIVKDGIGRLEALPVG